MDRARRSVAAADAEGTRMDTNGSVTGPAKDWIPRVPCLQLTHVGTT
jgi:hypothetical protein